MARLAYHFLRLGVSFLAGLAVDFLEDVIAFIATDFVFFAAVLIFAAAVRIGLLDADFPFVNLFPAVFPAIPPTMAPTAAPSGPSIEPTAAPAATPLTVARSGLVSSDFCLVRFWVLAILSSVSLLD